ncbi:putative colanic acid biosynthesis acetyltransferase [Neptunomonas qingdaonensis]|uniref:Putative colanic acid biosynthesis acetyltransferase WcaF n=1 Tax=Neptunomonas qingdaonensis TaxID=1045558 RepID=A0A1I2VSN8_9GAMM|nr:putative colanic acid biosynthesis acetyltransferase [Neptunomonas qingdaonensis]SFG92160.1 putative colanic acid biosynthesis acetyltransferase WcaF [Neptunomonas qingdaonensis]
MFQNLEKFTVPHGFRGRNIFTVQLWWFVSSLLFACSPQFMYRWRVFILKCFGASIGDNVIIRPSVKITYPWKLTIGDNSWIGDDVELYTLGEIIIGSNSVVSQRSYLSTGSHDYQSDTFDIFAKPIIIKDEVWIATDVFIAPAVTIGKGCVVGARSSVYQDMPAGMICYGYPAKPIKPRIGNEVPTLQP